MKDRFIVEAQAAVGEEGTFELPLVDKKQHRPVVMDIASQHVPQGIRPGLEIVEAGKTGMQIQACLRQIHTIPLLYSSIQIHLRQIA